MLTQSEIIKAQHLNVVTYSNPEEWKTLKKPVLPSNTLGTLSRIFIAVELIGSYVNTGGIGGRGGKDGPISLILNIEGKWSALKYLWYHMYNSS